MISNSLMNFYFDFISGLAWFSLGCAVTLLLFTQKINSIIIERKKMLRETIASTMVNKMNETFTDVTEPTIQVIKEFYLKILDSMEIIGEKYKEVERPRELLKSSILSFLIVFIVLIIARFYSYSNNPLGLKISLVGLSLFLFGIIRVFQILWNIFILFDEEE